MKPEFRLESLAPTVCSQIPVYLARPSGEREPTTPQEGGGDGPGEAKERFVRSDLGVEHQHPGPESGRICLLPVVDQFCFQKHKHPPERPGVLPRPARLKQIRDEVS